MSSPYLSQFAAVFQQITDPRHKRGVRHPFAGLLALVFLGTLAGMTEIAVIRRSGLTPRILKIRDAGVSVLHLFRKTGESIREIAETIHFRPKAFANK